jgi:hypothetical protein
MLDLQSFSEELARHGLKQDNYAQVAKYCSNRIRSLRLQNGLKYTPSKSSNKFSFKSPSHSQILSNSKVAQIPIYTITKLWSRIQVLQTEARTQPRKRHYIRKLSHKIQRFADSQMCHRNKSFDDYLFYIWAKGISYFSSNKIAEAKAFLETFSKNIPSELGSMAPWKSVDTLVRFCDYQLKKTPSSSPTQVPIFDKECDKEFTIVHGIRLSIPSAFKNSFKTKKAPKENHAILTPLFDISQAIKKGNLLNDNELLQKTIKGLKDCKEFKDLETFLKAHFAQNSGSVELAKSLYKQVSTSLKSGVQLFPVFLKPKGKSDTSLAKTLIGAEGYDRITTLPVPIKPIVYDLAYDHLENGPAMPASSKPGLFNAFWK